MADAAAETTQLLAAAARGSQADWVSYATATAPGCGGRRLDPGLLDDQIRKRANRKSLARVGGIDLRQLASAFRTEERTRLPFVAAGPTSKRAGTPVRSSRLVVTAPIVVRPVRRPGIVVAVDGPDIGGRGNE
jgi:hypothetical protein